MPIQPVSGEIKAQPINNNFSYLESLALRANGGPIDEVSTIEELTSKYPNGANGVVLVDGIIYLWDGSAWFTNGTVYQARALANGTVSYPKIADQLNYLESSLITENKYMQSVSSDGTITFTDTANYWLSTLDLPTKGKLTITKSNLQHGQAIAIVDSLKKAIAFWSFDFGTMFNSSWANSFEENYVIDTFLLKQAYPSAKALIIEFRVEDRNSAYIYGVETADISEKDWGTGPDFEAIRNIPNRIADKYDMLIESSSVVYPNKSIPRFDSSTGLPEFSNATNRTSYYFKIPERGTLEFPIYTLPDQQFFLIADKDKKVLANFDYTYNTGTNTVDFLKKDSNNFVIDILKLKEFSSEVNGLYLVVWNKAVDGFYVEAKNAFLVSEMFSAAVEATDILREKELVLPAEYPIVQGKTGYIYLDNINLNGNYYVENDIFVSQSISNDLIAGGYPIKMENSDITLPLSRNKHGAIIQQASILIKKVSADAGSGIIKKVLAIGESTTEAPAYRNALIDRFKEDPMSIQMIGTRGEGQTLHEGRSGWTTDHFLHSQSYNGITNSFYNPDTSQFDFEYFLEKNNIEMPEIVLLRFGINDPNQGLSSEKTIANLYTIINQIKAVKADAKFLIGLSSNLCRIENVAYRTESRRNNILETIKSLIIEFDNRKSEGYYLEPTYLNVDPIWDMQYEEKPISIYQSKTMLFATDGTHPANETGYQKAADTTYFTIKKMYEGV